MYNIQTTIFAHLFQPNNNQLILRLCRPCQPLPIFLLPTFEQLLPAFFAGLFCGHLQTFADFCRPKRRLLMYVHNGTCRPLPLFDFDGLFQQLTAYVKVDLFCRPFLRAFADFCQPFPTCSIQQLQAYIEAS
jgi:hypothetical protein